MKKTLRTAGIAVILVASLALATVGGTFAYFTATDAKQATAGVGTVTTEIPENLDTKNAQVKNTGNVPCFVRVRMDINFAALAPELNTSLGSGWALGTDGYYYYTKPLAVGDTTPYIFGESDGAVKLDSSKDYAGLKITFVQEAVQATLYGAGEGGADIPSDPNADDYKEVWSYMDAVGQATKNG